MEPTSERLKDEIHFVEQETSGHEETKDVIFFEYAWPREIEYRERIKLKSIQAHVDSGLPNASSQELPPGTISNGTKRKLTFLPHPLKREVPLSPSLSAACQFRNYHTPSQQLQPQQAPTEQHKSQHSQNRPSPRQYQSFKNPLSPLPNELQVTERDIYYRLKPRQTLGQHSRPRHLPNLQAPPKQLNNNLQSSPFQRPLLPTPLGNHLQLSRYQRPLLPTPKKQALDLHPQPAELDNHPLVICNDHLPSSSNLMNPRWCDLCKVPCMSNLNYEQHCQGRKHKTNWEEAFGNSQEVEMKKHKVLWCNECRIPCVNELALSQHLVGKKHINRLLELQIVNVRSPDVCKFSEQ